MRYFTSACALLAAQLMTTSLSVFAHEGEDHASSANQTPTANAANVSDADLQADIVVTDGWVSSGPDVLKVKRGDNVNVRFVSNQTDELHLHGYDITVQLAPNTPALLSFTAKYPGRFGYELHKAHREIGAIEVHP